MRFRMARPPRKKKPKDPNYQHFLLHGPGFWTLPELIRCQGVERSRETNIFVIRASTYQNRRLAIPLLVPAVASLIAAPPTVGFETLTRGRRIEPPEKGKTLEVVRLDRFVCFRVITADRWVLEFLTKSDQHILVPFSSAAYKQFIKHLKDTVC
jgi:hypothetical protein